MFICRQIYFNFIFDFVISNNLFCLCVNFEYATQFETPRILHMTKCLNSTCFRNGEHSLCTCMNNRRPIKCTVTTIVLSRHKCIYYTENSVFSVSKLVSYFCRQDLCTQTGMSHYADAGISSKEQSCGKNWAR